MYLMGHSRSRSLVNGVGRRNTSRQIALVKGGKLLEYAGHTNAENAVKERDIASIYTYESLLNNRVQILNQTSLKVTTSQDKIHQIPPTVHQLVVN